MEHTEDVHEVLAVRANPPRAGGDAALPDLRPPVARRLWSAAGRLGRALAVTLTRPLPDHVAPDREPARSALLVAALAIVAVTLVVLPRGAVDGTPLLMLGAAAAAFGVASLMPSLQGFLNRVDGLLALALIATLVTASGGSTSIYRPLLVLLLLYAALFYDTGRLVATGVLIAAVVLSPLLFWGVDASYVAVLLVEVPVWALLAGVVHALVQRSRATARTDGLTGLSNHVTFHSMLHSEHERMLRYGSPYSVLLVDLDHFKRINDDHGHPVGDEVLRGVGRLLGHRARLTDTVARYGGEEFALLLPETARADATTVAQGLCAAVRAADLPVRATVSIGVASSSDGLVHTAEALLAAADQALYEAKRAGRDRIAVCLPETAAFAYLSEAG